MHGQAACFVRFAPIVNQDNLRQRCVMIHLTRLNNTNFAINSDLIKFVEQSPDTVITLLSGEKILVRESAEEVLSRVVDFRRRLLIGSGAWHLADASRLPMADAPTGENEG